MVESEPHTPMVMAGPVGSAMVDVCKEAASNSSSMIMKWTQTGVGECLQSSRYKRSRVYSHLLYGGTRNKATQPVEAQTRPEPQAQGVGSGTRPCRSLLSGSKSRGVYGTSWRWIKLGLPPTTLKTVGGTNV